MEVIGVIIIVIIAYVAWKWFLGSQGTGADIANIITMLVKKAWPLIACVIVFFIFFGFLL